jgi:hypothetical protein
MALCLLLRTLLLASILLLLRSVLPWLLRVDVLTLHLLLCHVLSWLLLLDLWLPNLLLLLPCRVCLSLPLGNPPCLGLLLGQLPHRLLALYPAFHEWFSEQPGETVL